MPNCSSQKRFLLQKLLVHRKMKIKRNFLIQNQYNFIFLEIPKFVRKPRAPSAHLVRLATNVCAGPWSIDLRVSVADFWRFPNFPLALLHFHHVHFHFRPQFHRAPQCAMRCGLRATVECDFLCRERRWLVPAADGTPTKSWHTTADSPCRNRQPSSRPAANHPFQHPEMLWFAGDFRTYVICKWKDAGLHS